MLGVYHDLPEYVAPVYVGLLVRVLHVAALVKHSL
jgi:hypothetical protein